MLTADKVDLKPGRSIRIGWVEDPELPRFWWPTGVLGDSAVGRMVVVLGGNGVEMSVRTCKTGVKGLRQGVAVDGVRIWNLGGSKEVFNLLMDCDCAVWARESTLWSWVTSALLAVAERATLSDANVSAAMAGCSDKGSDGSQGPVVPSMAAGSPISRRRLTGEMTRTGEWTTVGTEYGYLEQAAPRQKERNKSPAGLI